ncbi:tRNA (adenosine(37)-N6)-dimethylallyltransferase MiaA [Occallatibacter riparius]|uniref:tRNA dimethylallyltransferase n=1 Tax=Occallatibacter riparius TaxID=1002689 RepID=A0A9J7BTS5_9BACT|nr:tRNA (adenosine(37)-N6)-dimethylallyltransferase MiaA [Occallatibacter riparius]UWZ85993.1 tRNA (adenosine(37)-N6)-dimethylallyltransferase MiaA [Occallatibacter riparius]
MRNQDHSASGEIAPKNTGRVKGHDFSRADALLKMNGALAPEGSSSTSTAHDHPAAHSGLSKIPKPVHARPSPLVLILLGPTGSGKTALSLELADRFAGEIVSCDSVAVYRGMDLGSAKPSPEERSRAPHHLIDVADPDEPMTAGAYSRAARAALADITARAHLPIVTGGTGLYLRALTEGLFAGPQRDEDLRKRLRASATKHGSSWLHRILTRLDPSTADRIHANDTPKLIRAVEVCLAGRRPMSAVFASQDEARDPLTGYRLLRIGLNPPRQALYEHLNRRCAEMFAAGLVEEARRLLACYGRVKALDSLGYRQALSVIDGEADLPAAVAAAQQGHRNYAKRQLTWFRREPDVHWIEAFGDDPATLATVKQIVEASQCGPTP